MRYQRPRLLLSKEKVLSSLDGADHLLYQIDRQVHEVYNYKLTYGVLRGGRLNPLPANTVTAVQSDSTYRRPSQSYWRPSQLSTGNRGNTKPSQFISGG